MAVHINSADMNSNKKIMTVRHMEIDASDGDEDAIKLYELLSSIAKKTGDAIYDEAWMDEPGN